MLYGCLARHSISGKTRKLRAMGHVIPTAQRPVREILICIANVTGNGLESDLAGALKGQRAAEL